MISFLAKLAITVVLLVALAYQVDLRAAFLRLQSLGLATITACLVLNLLQIIALAYRWNRVNRMLRLPLPFTEAVRCTLACQFFSQGLPASVGGDALRVWWLLRLGTSASRAIGSVLLDRIAGFLPLVVLSIFTLATLFFLFRDAGIATRATLGAVAAVALMTFAASRVVSRVLARLTIWVRATVGRHSALSNILAWGLKLQFGTWRLVYSAPGLRVLSWGLAIHATTIIVCYLVVVDVRLSVSFLQVVAVVPSVMLLSYIPLSIGGWGLREAAMAFGFSLVGLPKEEGIFLGVAVGSLGLGAALIGALVWLLSPMPITLFGQPIRSD